MVDEKSHKDVSALATDAGCRHCHENPDKTKSTEPSDKVLSEVCATEECTCNLDGPAEVKIFNNVQKSKLDKREYRALILKNGLRVMLISDENTNRSAVCMDVNVGSWSDPPELPGLAHFCEHMLFLGTEKYPEPNDYSDFVSKHSGVKNAYTSPINTNFYFDIDPDYLEPALDRFVQFFISPTFDAKYMEKELNIIQSEFDLSFDSDINKKIHVSRETCDKSHDYAKFNVGNKKTLKEDPEANGIDVRERLLEFYSKHYSANVMCLCVLGKNSLDELYAMITERLPFGEIQNKKINLKLRSELLAKSAFKAEHLQKEIRIVPNKEMNQLTIDFKPNEFYKSLNVKDRLYAITAEDYIANVFNQKGEGSILAELKDRRGLVNSISLFANGIVANLTKEAVKTGKIDEIVKTVFQFFNFVKRDGVHQWIFDEKMRIAEIAYNNREKEDPLSKVLNIAVKMQIYKLENVVQCAYFNREFRPEFIGQLIDNLKAENMRLTLISKKFEGTTDRKERYYNIDYSYTDIAKERIDSWADVGFNENLKVHRPNEYIPANLELVERENEKQKVPVLIKQDKLCNVWYLQDNEFNTPRSFYGLHLKNPFLNIDPAAVTLMALYCRLLNESLIEYSSQAAQAGILYLVSVTHDGLLVEVDGYSEKLPIILNKIMDKLLKFDFSSDRFEKHKENELRFWQNYHKQPLSILLSGFHSFLLLHQHTVSDILESMHQVTFEKLQSLTERFFSRLFINLFVHGNVNRKDVELVESMTKDRLIETYHTSIVLKSSFPNKRCVKLDDNSYYIYQHISKDHHQNGVLLFYQVGLETPSEIVKVDLLTTMLNEKFYHHIRTEQQLGYSVLMGAGSNAGVQGFKFFIQSSFKPQLLDDRIEQFIEWAADYLSKLSESDFATYKKSLTVTYSEPIRMLYSQSIRFWFDIIDRRPFNKREAKLEALQEVTKEQIVSLFNEHLVRRRRKLSIRLIGQKKITAEVGTGKRSQTDQAISKLTEANNLVGDELVESLISEALANLQVEDKPKDESEVGLNDVQPNNEPVELVPKSDEPKAVKSESSAPKESVDDAVDDELPKNAKLITNILEFQQALEEYPNPSSLLIAGDQNAAQNA